MSYKISRVDVWVADVLNRPGMLARILEALSSAGAELEFLVARRATRNTSRVFLAPLRGARQKRAAKDAGMIPADGLFALRITGRDRPGLGARLTRAVAAQGINLRGASAASIGNIALFYLAFESAGDASEAARAIRRALASRRG
jgi:predicted amino acid-binding ACT domain protein